MNKKMVIGNHKNYMVVSDISKYLKKINDEIDSKNVVICPSNIYIPYFLKQSYSVGIQNVFIRSEGSYTGEITSKQAKSIGINYAIIGHSERRIYFDEIDSDINKKIVDALRYNIKVILCVGETLEEKNMLKTARVLKKQLSLGLRNIDNFDNIIIAYEPVWAIGSNIIPSNIDISKTAQFIKETVKSLYNYEDISVLYGGSVNSKNIRNINKIEELSGVLVGKASTDSNEFLKIIEVVIE